MPIAVTCPHCQTRYPKIPDDFAGKTVKCKKTECRQDFLVPVPLKAEELEAAALAALNDAPAQEEKPAAERMIPMVCASCEHKWSEPFSKAGKNVLCPECRVRVKVPEPKPEKGDDWRQQNSKRPSLAKENFEKPDDVQGGEATMVGGGALKAAGYGVEEFEPIPLKRKIMFVAVPLAIVALIFFGVRGLLRSRSDSKNDQLIVDALKEYNDAAEESKPPGGEASLFSAVLSTAAGEYTLRLNDKNKLKDALAHFSKALQEIAQATSKDDPKKMQSVAASRYAVACELAVTQLSLGGSDKEIADSIRIRWMPDASGRPPRPNERRDSVRQVLIPTLSHLTNAEFDLKATLLRRLVRELAVKGQPELAADLPSLLFTEPEQAEAKAIVGVELYRADKGSEMAKRIAEDLKNQLADASRPRAPFPATAQTLWLLLDTQKTPSIVNAPAPGTGEILDSTRHAYAGFHLIQGRTDEAFALAQRPGSAGGRLRALILCAEWSPDPTQALDMAVSIVNIESRKKDGPQPPQYAILRLAQLAGAANKTEQAKSLSEALVDEGLRAWAKADGVRLRLIATKSAKVEEGLLDLPKESKDLHAGHAWGCLAVARNNGAVAKNRDAVKQFADWPRGTLYPFALAGVALGIQDP